MHIGKSNYLVRFVSICLILLISSINSIGQEATSVKNSKNSILLDGATLKFIGMYSFNYERAVILSDHFRMLGNAGVGGWYFTTISKWYSGYSMPVSLNNLIGSGDNYFDLQVV